VSDQNVLKIRDIAREGSSLNFKTRKYLPDSDSEDAVNRVLVVSLQY
jgi:hypothetical protein